MSEKTSKVFSVLKKDGFALTAKKVGKYVSGSIKRRLKLTYKSNWKKYGSEYVRLIDDALAGEFERVIVWRSTFGWNVPLFQRPQHISNKLSDAGCLVFYEVTSMTDDVVAIKKLKENLYLVNFENSFISDALLNALDKVSAPKFLQIYSTNWNMTLPEALSYKEKGYKILYEYIDKISPALSGTRELPKNISEKYNYAMEHPEDVYVVTTADILYRDVVSKRGDKNLVLSSNGVDYDFFKDLSDPPRADNRIEEIKKSKKTLVGYYGAMAEWIDYELLREIDATDEFIFVLIGSKYDDSLEKSGVLSLKNIVYLGSVEYKVLKYYASELDVLTIPFLINGITAATSPLKLFEYMALGKPIVTTAMNECMKYKTPMIAHDRREFINLLRVAAARKTDNEYLENLDSEARGNSWEKKAEDIINLIKD